MMGIRVHLTAVFGLLSVMFSSVLVAAWLFGIPWLGIEGVRPLRYNDAVATVGQYAEDGRMVIGNWLTERRIDMSIIAESRSFVDAMGRRGKVGGAAIREQFDSLIRIVPDSYVDLFAIAADGSLVATTRKDGAVPPEIREHLPDFLADGMTEILDTAHTSGGANYVIISRQVPGAGADGAVSGVLVALINPGKALEAFTRAKKSGGYDSRVLLINEKGLVLASNSGPSPSGETVDRLLIDRAKLLNDGNYTDSSGDGTTYLTLTRFIPVSMSEGWSIAIAVNHDSILKPFSRSLARIAVFGAGMLVVAFFAVSLIAMLMSLPIRRLQSAALRFENGDLGVRVKPYHGSPTEIMQLVQTFNALADNVENWHRELELAVTERTAELAESRELLQSFMDNTSAVIYLKDADGRYIFINRQFEGLFGVPRRDAAGKSDFDLFPAEAAEQFRRNDMLVIRQGAVVEAEETVPHADGDHCYISIKFPLRDTSGKIYAVGGISTDITERKRAEEARLKLEQQFLHSQKLESLGVLAGGVAHDFNNILTAIIGNADLALMRLPPESPVLDNLQRIGTAAVRAADLARQMLAYSGRGKFVVESINLNRLVEEMGQMLEVSISKKAVLRFNLTTALPPVEADATQLRQVIMNLVINASEAIGERSGFISITTGSMECDPGYLKEVWLDENLTAGLYVYLEVADSGCGMDRETLAKLFDPFFTTKFTGRGLGMAAVLGIVRGHHGAIKVYSEPGKGTTFKILLPASDTPAEQSGSAGHSSDRRGSGTVLLVDDEEAIRGIGTEMLKELGFSTITANDGREAVETYRNSSDIAFVILDLTMPHMDGEQCFRELRRINPDVKVIISSGYNEQEVTQKFVGKGLAGFIQKPYRLEALREVIQQISG